MTIPVPDGAHAATGGRCGRYGTTRTPGRRIDCPLWHRLISWFIERRG